MEYEVKIGSYGRLTKNIYKTKTNPETGPGACLDWVLGACLDWVLEHASTGPQTGPETDL